MEDYDDHRSVNKRIAEICNEKEYRRWLTHEYNASRESVHQCNDMSFITLLVVILPLWNPCPIDLGAVGYLSEPEGRFITLFNAFSPQNSDHGMVRNLPSINRYGQVKHGSQKLDKRSRLQKLDAITGPFAGLSRGVS
jgi:abelson tyrosine-protein kinase 1